MTLKVKKCSQCGDEKPHTMEFFDLAIRSAACRDCRNSFARMRRIATASTSVKVQDVRLLSDEIAQAITATVASIVAR